MIRSFVRETTLTMDDFIYPLFVTEAEERKEIQSMPGIEQIPLTQLAEEIEQLQTLGIQAIIIFGVPEAKDEVGSSAYDEAGVVQIAIRHIKDLAPHMLIIADTCLCAYTSHGHCGVVTGVHIHNDETLPLLAKTAVSQAEAGADLIAPSNMMDGTVHVIRQALDEAGFEHIPIMAYSVKYASSYYGPFRDAAESSPTFGDRHTYQMDIANRKEAFREVNADMEEGADIVIVKPALAYLDIIRDIYNQVNVPVVAYNVSGEYSMIKAAGEKGWIDEEAVIWESLLGMKRAGADMIITYFAKEMASFMQRKGD